MSDDASCVQVGDGVWAYLRVSGGWGETNTGLVRGADASAIIDTPWDTGRAREMLGLFAPHVEDAPVREIVNTHADGDHWWGNVTMPPEARITTSAAALEGMRAESSPREVRRLTTGAELLRHVPGKAGAMAGYLCGIFDGVEAPRDLRLPDRTFTGAITLEVGGRVIQLVEDGPAHTSGDVVAHVPEAGVVFAGDLLFIESTPILWHGPVENWLSALDRMIGLDAAVYVPGHGPLSTVDDVRSLRAYWQWVCADAREQFEAGRTPLVASRTMLTTAGSAPWADWLHAERLVISLHTLWRQWRGEALRPPGIRRRALAFADAGTLRRDLDRA